jgi:hypothetical protein
MENTEKHLLIEAIRATQRREVSVLLPPNTRLIPVWRWALTQDPEQVLIWFLEIQDKKCGRSARERMAISILIKKALDTFVKVTPNEDKKESES